MHPVKQGNTVKVEYTGTLDDGSVFDKSDGNPIEFKVGEGQVIPGFEEAVVGMKLNEEKNIHIPAAQAYGDYMPDLVRKFPRASLPKDQEPVVGMMLVLKTPDGHQLPVKITEVSDEEVTIDINHPLAGKALNFAIKVVHIAG